MHLRLWEKARDDLRSTTEHQKLEVYRFDPVGYIRDKLGWQPWAGADGLPGQLEVLRAYTLALRQQHERYAYEHGEIAMDDLAYWRPGTVIQNRIRIEAGHGIGKTKLASGLINHFFDCCVPAIAYTFAPTWEQTKDLLWKEIASDRQKANLPGRVLETCEIKTLDHNHFAKGRATQNSKGKGTERIQGQHNKYLIFILDEAEGIDDFVWNAIDSMASGGIVIVIMLGNPRTRSSAFHKQASRSTVRNFRLSCLNHPNVRAGKEIIPGAVRRDYVLEMLEEHAEIVDEHDEDKFTFTLPWDEGETIYLPDDEYLFRVLGIPALNTSDNTFVPVGRYEAATKRASPDDDPFDARIGIDAARYGGDFGTIYTLHKGVVWRHAKLQQEDTAPYVGQTKELARQLYEAGARSLHIRVDAGGGFSSGVVDNLKDDPDLKKWFYRDFQIIEVHFGGSAEDKKAYMDISTQMYAATGQALKHIAVRRPPNELMADLTERPYKWTLLSGVSVKKLVDKEQFKKEFGRSPDDGDGFCLAVAPDYIFEGKTVKAA